MLCAGPVSCPIQALNDSANRLDQSELDTQVTGDSSLLDGLFVAAGSFAAD